MRDAAREAAPIAVYLELGTRRVFACAFDWPGWCRSGRDEASALEALRNSAARYAVVAAEAGFPLPGDAGEAFEVVEHVQGSSSTDFGVPYEVPARDREALGSGDAERLSALVAASWTVLERVAAGAPAALRKGPRGGGRDRDRIVEHVREGEAAYARKLGLRRTGGDDAGVARLRRAMLETLRAPSTGAPLAEKGWPPRYAARRIAWHVLDHAWEIEGRSV